jgi:hypothetical protein
LNPKLRPVNDRLDILLAFPNSVPHPLCQIIKGAELPLLGLALLVGGCRGKISGRYGRDVFIRRRQLGRGRRDIHGSEGHRLRPWP